MNNLCIIPCGNKKIWDTKPFVNQVQAGNAYTGVFHKLCRRYAEHFKINWVVLSAKHGYLLPEDIVEGPYDLSFSHKSESIISIPELQNQVKEKRLDAFSVVHVLTGRKYKPYIENSFQDDDLLIKYPLAEAKGIGYMQKMLKDAVQNNKQFL